MPTPHDAAWKHLFSFRDMTRDLLAGFLPPQWLEGLDLHTLERWPESHVSEDLRERRADRVWRVRFRNQWLYVLVLLEFQSAVDRIMALRILEYTTRLCREWLRERPSAPLPLVFPIVLYQGARAWSAPREVAELLAPHDASLAPYQPAQRYFLLDVGRYTGSLPTDRNLMAALIRLAHSRNQEEVDAVFGALDEWLTAPEHQELNRAIETWVSVLHASAPRERRGPPAPEQPTEEQPMLRERWQEWRAQDRAEGRNEGQIAVMRRQAARKFGAETAERLAERLAEIADPEQVGEWLIECDDADALLARVARLCGTETNGGASPQG